MPGNKQSSSPNKKDFSSAGSNTGGQNDDSYLNIGDSLTTEFSESGNQNTSRSGRGNQGFASMPKEKQREIASKGGKAAHAQGTAHEWDSSEAAEAGRRGGKNRSQKAA